MMMVVHRQPQEASLRFLGLFVTPLQLNLTPLQLTKGAVTLLDGLEEHRCPTNAHGLRGRVACKVLLKRGLEEALIFLRCSGWQPVHVEE
eukprot:624508-Prymnesium_polylepis.3